ncbi:unnamed protein product [Hermetia illucens]|uniref:DBB domain-containing protein n=1 Tax=Hermetia illucens TaxID=343691 RepID=A0A7R8URH0_HERIL|nr:uncharacterized protein LOC119651770 isoform X2 [Hermetia illucens]XP_037911441.1 uncharacterized protein LOC119651770 isoform X2 [Hermetia illucens]XP_037911442.1 uncharacterized protein LOC119651770 isoform X2 [Hermetia illucens]CAD7084728.1 unnamed protein product [Hermetia illucens]
MSIDNPYYFYNEKSPQTPDSNSKGFSFFKRRNSKGSSGNCSKITTPTKCRGINSATLISDASVLGSPRGSLGSLASSPLCSPTFEVHTINFNSATLRRSNFAQYRERLGSYNESVSYHDNDDVFCQPPRHQMSRTLPDKYSGTNGLRRHSAGNFSSRDHGSTCGLISDEVPKMPAPRPPAVVSTRHRKRDNCQNTNMDDILIITAKHSERAILWANFLKTRFDKITKQRGRKPFNFLHIKIDDGTLTPSLIQTCQTTPLQIVIICPALMALSQTVLSSQLSVILNIEKVLAILIEVSMNKVLETHKEAFPYFRKWRKCEVTTNDQSLIGNILGIATDILGRALCQRPPCQESAGQPLKAAGNGEAFTVTPRKVKIGQNKILALLTDPLTKDDWIKITIVKGGEVIDVMTFKRRNPYTLQFTVPETCMEISTMVEIRIEKNGQDLGSRPVKCESRLRELEQLLRSQDSPLEFMCHSLSMPSTDRDALDQHLLQCFQRNMPPNFHLLGGPYEKQNHITALKDTNAEEYPTLLHFAAKWGLSRLAIQLLECPGGDAACEIRNYSGKTPSEMAEQGGFPKLANSLKDFVQMQELTTIYHRCINYTPQNKVIIDAKPEPPKLVEGKLLANQMNGNAESQAEYMEMNSSSSEGEAAAMPETLAVENLNYINIDTTDSCNLQTSEENIKKGDQVKIIESTEMVSNELRINEPPYYESKDSNNKCDKFSTECLNVLENCSSGQSSSQSYYILQPSNIPVPESVAPIQQQSSYYLTQPSNRPIETNNYINGSVQNHDLNRRSDESDSHFKLVFEKKKPEPLKINNGTLKRTGSDASKGNADDELAEIMYDFKNNVLTIREVEQLVEKWKNRNDVKQSFKEKQEQIERMREEYDRIQEQLKERLKRPTPFERVKKLFSRNKPSKPVQTEEVDEMKTSVTSFQSSSQRPTSSLSMQSLSSLSSSGRMSTGSACSGTSLGDSGTHSDHEDRRQIYNCRLGNPGSLLDNYLVPPAPRPVLTPASTPTPVEEKDRLIFTSNSRTTTPTNQSEHYILFPSNIPVFPSPTESHCSDQSSPFSSQLNTIVETKETPNESVGATVQPIKVQNNKDAIYSQIQQRSKNESTTCCSSFRSPPTSPKVLKNGLRLPGIGEYRNLENQKPDTNEYQNLNGSTVAELPNQNKVENGNAHLENNENHNYINV